MIYVQKAQDMEFWKKKFFKILWNFGHFFWDFFVKKSKYNLPGKYKFHKKLFLKALEYHTSQNNCLHDLRTKDTRYEILGGKKFKIWWKLGHFCNIVFLGDSKNRAHARGHMLLQNIFHDVKNIFDNIGCVRIKHTNFPKLIRIFQYTDLGGYVLKRWCQSIYKEISIVLQKTHVTICKMHTLLLIPETL